MTYYENTVKTFTGHDALLIHLYFKTTNPLIVKNLF